MNLTIAIITETMEVICVDSLDGKEQERIQLNFSEYRMLAFLLKNEQNISNRSQLLKEGWPGKFVTENSLNVSIMKLRKKIEGLQCDIQIKTYLGKGYKLLYSKEEEILLFETYDKFVECVNKKLAVEDQQQDEEVSVSIDKLSSSSSGVVKKKGKLFSNLSSFNRMLMFFVISILVTVFLFFSFYFESFSDFNCSDKEVCSFIMSDDF